MSRRSKHLSHRVLRPFLLLAVVLAVSTFLLAAVAHAEQTRPVTRCGSTVDWSVSPGLVSAEKELAPAAVAWAYAQVAPVARLTTRPVVGLSKGSVDFHWIDSFTGDRTVPGDAETTALLSDRSIWVHSHAQDDAATAASVRALVLTDILHDLGIANPTSGPGGLSPADRAAITTACAAQAAPPVVAPAKTPAPGGAAPAATPMAEATPAPTADGGAPKAVAPFHTAGLVLGAVVLVLAVAYTARPALFTRPRKAAPEGVTG